MNANEMFDLLKKQLIFTYSLASISIHTSADFLFLEYLLKYKRNDTKKNPICNFYLFSGILFSDRFITYC